MSAVQASNCAALEQLADDFKAAAREFHGVDMIVFCRPDLFREENERQARRIFIPHPSPVAAEWDREAYCGLFDQIKAAGLLDRLFEEGINGPLREAIRDAGVDAERFERLHTLDEMAERRKQHDGEMAAMSAAHAWETLIPWSGRLIVDQHGSPIWRHTVRHPTEQTELWALHLVGIHVNITPDPRPGRFDRLAYEAYRLIPACGKEGDTPASSWLIHLANRDRPLRPAGWDNPPTFRDQRRILDYEPVLHGAPLPVWGRSASQPDEASGRRFHNWWAVRLADVFWQSELAVRYEADQIAADRIRSSADTLTTGGAEVAASLPVVPHQSNSAGDQLSLRARITAFVTDRAEALRRLPTRNEVYAAFPNDDLGSKASFYRRNPWYKTIRAATKACIQHDAPPKGHENYDDDGTIGGVDASSPSPDYHRDEEG